MSNTINRNTTDEEAKTLLIEISKKGKLPFNVNEDSIVRRFTNGSQSLPLAVYPDGSENNEFVVRMPRSEGATEEMKQDSIFSEYLNSRITKTQIPKVLFIENDGSVPIAVHRSIQGKTMDFAGQDDTLHYADLSEIQKRFLAQDLAVFFYELHQIPIDNQTIIPQSSVKYYSKEKSGRYRELMKRFGINMDDFNTVEEEDSVCCHNDCHGGNMAFNEKKEHVLQGVFDFGMCGINNRSSDFVKLYQIDRELARLTINEYNRISPKKVNIKDTDRQYLAWQAENLMLPEKAPEHWDEQSKNKLQIAIGKTLIKFKRDLNREKQQGENDPPNDKKLLKLSGRISPNNQRISPIPNTTNHSQQGGCISKARSISQCY